MNERILSPQLLKLVQAAGPGYSLADPEWVKKFAELIVRECAELCLKYETCGDMGKPAEYRKGVHFNTVIKAHFGVEE